MVTVADFNRPNLFLEVKLKGVSIHQDLKSCLSADESGSTIVYCPTKKATEQVARVLKGKNLF